MFFTKQYTHMFQHQRLAALSIALDCSQDHMEYLNCKFC